MTQAKMDDVAAEKYAVDHEEATLNIERLKLAFLAGIAYRDKNPTHKCNLVPYGTDGCSECEVGRITLFYDGSLECIQCQHEKLKGGRNV